MKRSEINQILVDAKAFMAQKQFFLPPWAYWSMVDWEKNKENTHEVIENMLGWDITDFGNDNFSKQGLLLFTLRNGNFKKDKKPYAEKVMIVEELQETPMHFHWSKMEDIINRGGGNLVIDLCDSDENENFSDKQFTVKTDGVVRRLQSGDSVILTPGESICLVQGLYHRFYGESGKGKVLVGEVSAVNDDANDNNFNPPVGRFPEIEEDEAPIHLLASDYMKFL